MKLLGRTLAILVAALLIVGATVAFAGTSSAASGVPARSEFRPADGQADAARFGPERGDGFRLFAAAEMLKNLALMGVIVALVGLARHLGRKRIRPLAPRATPVGQCETVAIPPALEKRQRLRRTTNDQLRMR